MHIKKHTKSDSDMSLSQAIHECETGQTETIGSLSDFNKYIKRLEDTEVHINVNNLREKAEVGDIVSIPNVIEKGVISYFIVSKLYIPKNNLNDVYVLINLQTGENFDIRLYTDNKSYHNIQDFYNIEEIDSFVKDRGGTIYKSDGLYLELNEI